MSCRARRSRRARIDTPCEQAEAVNDVDTGVGVDDAAQGLLTAATSTPLALATGAGGCWAAMGLLGAGRVISVRFSSWLLLLPRGQTVAGGGRLLLVCLA